jgi:hypothetical protein
VSFVFPTNGRSFELTSWLELDSLTNRVEMLAWPRDKIETSRVERKRADHELTSHDSVSV